jgi:two-component sensor histidine kinase
MPLQAAGKPGFLKIMRDQTARHRADQMNQLLIGEIKHRVNNTLALVQAVVRETLRGQVCESEIRDALDSRLSALARSHDLLAQEDWTGASLNEVITRTLMPFIAQERLEEVLVTEGKDVRLPANLALLLALGFHELATNAAKYGALSVPGGSIEIRWAERPSEAGDVLKLNWRERNGPPVSPPKQKGFGSRLVERALAREVNGTADLKYFPEGLRFEIAIPMSALR